MILRDQTGETKKIEGTLENRIKQLRRNRETVERIKVIIENRAKKNSSMNEEETEVNSCESCYEEQQDIIDTGYSAEDLSSAPKDERSKLKRFLEEVRREREKEMREGLKKKTDEEVEDILLNYYDSCFEEQRDIIDAKYSLGNPVSELEDEFKNCVEDITKMRARNLFYLDALKITSLGILLEAEETEMEKIATVVKQAKIKDAILDYLLGVSLKKWKRQSLRFDKKVPYRELVDIINTACVNTEKASLMITKYMDKKWFRGHFDYGYKNEHKELEYVGLWSYETAALVKILKLDDSRLRDNPHYPYDLAHYKNGREYEIKTLELPKEKEPVYVYGIPQNPELELLIPLKCHSLVDSLISDYHELDLRKFYTKYKKIMELDEIWYTYKEFKEDNKEKDLLGTLIVFLLNSKECVLQLDYSEEIEAYVEGMESYFGEEETKLVNFNVGNDQYYYAFIPKRCNIEKMYEVTIENVQ